MVRENVGRRRAGVEPGQRCSFRRTAQGINAPQSSPPPLPPYNQRAILYGRVFFAATLLMNLLLL